MKKLIYGLFIIMGIISCVNTQQIRSNKLEATIKEDQKPATYCERTSHYRIDIKARALMDSLTAFQIDTILYYRRISTLTKAPISSLHAEGYLFWKQNNLVKKLALLYIYDEVAIIDDVSTNKEKRFDFYWDNKIDTLLSLPKVTNVKYPNATGYEYLIYSKKNENLACYNITSYELREGCIDPVDTVHLRYQHIKMFTHGLF